MFISDLILTVIMMKLSSMKVKIKPYLINGSNDAQESACIDQEII